MNCCDYLPGSGNARIIFDVSPIDGSPSPRCIELKCSSDEFERHLAERLSSGGTVKIETADSLIPYIELCNCQVGTSGYLVKAGHRQYSLVLPPDLEVE